MSHWIIIAVAWIAVTVVSLLFVVTVESAESGNDDTFTEE